MDSPNTPRFRRYIILSILIILVSVAMLFWARDMIREVVVLPVSYLIYVIGVFIDYTPQIFFWIVLLLIGLRIAYLSISRNKKKEDEADLAAFYRPVNDKPVTSGRVVFWANKVTLLRSGRGVYYTNTFHEALGRTLFQLLSYRHRMTPLQIEEGVKNGSLAIPEDIRAYALQSLEFNEGVKFRFWSYLRDWISSTLRKIYFRLRFLFQRTSGDKTGSSGVDKNSLDTEERSEITQKMDPRLAGINDQVRRVLKFMEEELEVTHDNTGL